MILYNAVNVSRLMMVFLGNINTFVVTNARNKQNGTDSLWQKSFYNLFGTLIGCVISGMIICYLQFNITGLLCRSWMKTFANVFHQWKQLVKIRHFISSLRLVAPFTNIA